MKTKIVIDGVEYTKSSVLDVTPRLIQTLRSYLADIESGETSTPDHALKRAVLSVLAEDPDALSWSPQNNSDAREARAADRRTGKI